MNFFCWTEFVHRKVFRTLNCLKTHQEHSSQFTASKTKRKWRVAKFPTKFEWFEWKFPRIFFFIVSDNSAWWIHKFLHKTWKPTLRNFFFSFELNSRSLTWPDLNHCFAACNLHFYFHCDKLKMKFLLQRYRFVLVSHSWYHLFLSEKLNSVFLSFCCSLLHFKSSLFWKDENDFKKEKL